VALIIPQSNNFDWLGDGTRLVCPCCGCARPATERFRHHFELLQALRKWWDTSITLTSGYRCPAYNKKLGGAAKSQHILRRVPHDQNDDFATDLVARIDSTRIPPKRSKTKADTYERWFMGHIQLAERAIEIGFTGVGVYRGDFIKEITPSIHLDLRPGELATWGSREAEALSE